MIKLSDRIRPNSEAAPWVVEEVKRIESFLERLIEAGELIKETINSHEIETLDCDRRGEKYCDCLEKSLDSWDKVVKLRK
jgi:hypothetical protein